jgi:hypothetical protein
VSQNVPDPAPQDPIVPNHSRWPDRLMAALEIEGAAPDVSRLARTARIAAAASGHDDDAAATAFIAGYAAGLAEGTGQAGFDRAHAASLRAIERLLAAEVAHRSDPSQRPGPSAAEGTTTGKGPRP